MRMKDRLNTAILASAIVLAGSAWTATVHAAAISVGNGSFEMPDTLSAYPYSDKSVAAGGSQTAEMYTSQTAAAGTNHSATNGDVIPYWIVTTDAANVAGANPEAYGVDNPAGWKSKSGVYSDTEYYGTSGSRPDGAASNGVYSGLTQSTDYSFNSLAASDDTYGYSKADGYQFAYMNMTNATTQSTYNATFTYDPNDTQGNGDNPVVSLGNFVPGQTYTLTFAVGTRLDKTQYTYSGTLLDNGVAVGTPATGDSPASNSSSWTTATYTFTATDSGEIGIQLIGTGFNTQVNFDNVQLTAASAVPEPASLGLLGMGALALLTRRRKT